MTRAAFQQQMIEIVLLFQQGKAIIAVAARFAAKAGACVLAALPL
jgi:hypothetical protein